MNPSSFPRFEPVNPKRHAGWLLGPHTGYGFLRYFNSLEIMIGECHRVACDLPMLWQSQGGNAMTLSAVAVPGVFEWPVGRDDRWSGTYIPLLARVYPFFPGEPGTHGAGAYVDVNSEMVSPPGDDHDRDDWLPWFDGEGMVAPALATTIEVLRGAYRARQETSALGRTLMQMRLLEPVACSGIDLAGFRLDGRALDKAPGSVQEVLKRRGWLKALFAQLISLRHLSPVVRF